jgi:hypothetical protein
MLLLADRGFWSLVLWRACAATGARLLWRVKSDIRLPVRQPLPDGSWLSVVNGTREAHRRNMRNANRRSRGSRLPQEEGPLPGPVVAAVAPAYRARQYPPHAAAVSAEPCNPARRTAHTRTKPLDMPGEHGGHSARRSGHRFQTERPADLLLRAETRR